MTVANEDGDLLRENPNHARRRQEEEEAEAAEREDDDDDDNDSEAERDNVEQLVSGMASTTI